MQTQTIHNRVVLQYSSIIYAQTFIVKQPHTQSMHGSSHWPWNKTGITTSNENEGTYGPFRSGIRHLQQHHTAPLLS